MPQAKIEDGQRFGLLVVLGSYIGQRSTLRCKCDCGKTTKARAAHLISGRIVSCGCWRSRHRMLTLDDLLKRCDVRGPDECWPWRGVTQNRGYGVITFRGVEMVASRAVMAAIHGPIPHGLIVCHKCDNPPCVNPAHLFVGTYTDNVQDMIKKGRHFKGGGTKLLYCRKGLHLMSAARYVHPKSGATLCGLCMHERVNRWRREKDAKARLALKQPDKSGVSP